MPCAKHRQQEAEVDHVACNTPQIEQVTTDKSIDESAGTWQVMPDYTKPHPAVEALREVTSEKVAATREEDWAQTRAKHGDGPTASIITDAIIAQGLDPEQRYYVKHDVTAEDRKCCGQCQPRLRRRTITVTVEEYED